MNIQVANSRTHIEIEWLNENDSWKSLNYFNLTLKLQTDAYKLTYLFIITFDFDNREHTYIHKKQEAKHTRGIFYNQTGKYRNSEINAKYKCKYKK